jgi:ligand-binding SRPBCC domain-containing protein
VASPRIVTVTRRIEAGPEVLWDMVADITRMHEWSPEATAGTWVKGAVGPTVGARFKGENRNGSKRWTTECEITECERGRLFAFDATAGPMRYANWRYEFVPDGDATVISEIWLDRRKKLFSSLGRLISGVKDRAEHNRATMTATLEALDAAATR